MIYIYISSCPACKTYG